MNWNLVFVVAGVAATIVCKMDDYSKLNTVAQSIKSSAKLEVEDKIDISEMRKLKSEYQSSKTVFDNLKKAEAKEIDTRFKEDISAKEVTKNLDVLNRQYSKAKSAVDNFKADKIEVAVGAGDNSVSLSAENSSAKIALERDLADISAKRSAAQKELSDIKSSITKEVHSERASEYYDAKNSYDIASRNYNNAVEAENRSIDDLLNDRKWTHKEFVKAYQALHTKPELVAKGVIYSILPIGALVYIWKRVFDGINTLKEVV